MAKVIVAWCDPCMNNDEHTAGNPHVIALGVNAKPKEIDLCESHEKEFLTPLRELLGEVGQPVDGALPGMPSTPASSEDKADCPQCPPGRSLTREGLRGHMRKIHGMERQAANEVVRDTFGGNVRVQKPFNEQCPECKEAGVPVEESTFDTPQGFGAHRKAAHGVTGSGRSDR